MYSVLICTNMLTRTHITSHQITAQTHAHTHTHTHTQLTLYMTGFLALTSMMREVEWTQVSVVA